MPHSADEQPGHRIGHVTIFFLLTFALSWTCFISLAVVTRGPAITAAGYALLLLGTFAPSLVALFLTYRQEGQSGIAALWRRITNAPAGLRWYVYAIAFLPGIKLAVALVYRGIAGAWPPFGHESALIIAIAILFSTPVQAGEEVGWRGYALPRLAARFGYARASLLIGPIWGLWHLPLFMVPGEDYGQSFPLFLLGTTALSVAITWLYANTNGSLLLTMLMHSAVNQTVGIVPDSSAQPGNVFSFHARLTFYLTVGFLWLAAVYLLGSLLKKDARSSGDREPYARPGGAASLPSP